VIIVVALKRVLMDDKAYLLQIEHCMMEIQSLVEQKQAIDRRIANLQGIVKANAEMLPDQKKEAALFRLDDALPPTGFTDAIAYAVRRAGDKGITPTEVRSALIAAGVPLTQNNPMAAIHTVIKRLEDRGQVKVAMRKRLIPTPDGETEYPAYIWTGRRFFGGGLRAALRKA